MLCNQFFPVVTILCQIYSLVEIVYTEVFQLSFKTPISSVVIGLPWGFLVYLVASRSAVLAGERLSNLAMCPKKWILLCAIFIDHCV